MNGFKKLILTSAILAASSSAMAMQAMDEDSLSATTGQDGITIKLDVNMQNLDLRYIDRDGIVGDTATLPNLPYVHAGGIEISPIGITANGQVITIDAGGTAGDQTGSGQLRIGIQMGTLGNAADDTVVNLNNTVISVGDASDTSGSALGTTTAILSFDSNAELRIAAGAQMTMRLGNRQATDHLITMTSSIPSLALTGLTINDTVGGGNIGVGTLGMSNVSSTIGIDVVPSGLQINTTGTTVGGISMENVQLGTVNLTTRTNSIGDIYISGAGGGSIAMNNVITITGH